MLLLNPNKAQFKPIFSWSAIQECIPDSAVFCDTQTLLHLPEFLAFPERTQANFRPFTSLFTLKVRDGRKPL